MEALQTAGGSEGGSESPCARSGPEDFEILTVIMAAIRSPFSFMDGPRGRIAETATSAPGDRNEAR
jgi:hypothetical protein